MPAINLLNFYFSVLCLSLDLSLDNCAVWVECAEGRQETLDPLSIYLTVTLAILKCVPFYIT